MCWALAAPRQCTTIGGRSSTGLISDLYSSAIDSLGDDLALLSVRPDLGIVSARESLARGLMGSELVRLAWLGRIEIAGDAVVVRDPSPTGDAELDLALQSLAQAPHPPQARAWFGRPRRGIIDAYLARLTRSGALRPEQRRDLFRIRYTVWRITDPGRYADARGRLDAIAQSGGPIDTRAAAFAGLAHAAGVIGVIYRGRAEQDLRWRLEQIARGSQSGLAVAAARQAPGRPLDPLTDPLTYAAWNAAHLEVWRHSPDFYHWSEIGQCVAP